MMLKKGKTIALCLCTLVLLMGATTAYAATGNFHFEMYKNEGPYISSSVVKADSEQTAYVTPADGNVVGGDVFGFRVRTSAGSSATEYKTWTGLYRDTLNYSVIRGVANSYYRLYGQIDSTGEFNYTWVEGRWTP